MCHWDVCFAAFACSCHLLCLSVAASAMQHIMKHSTCDTFTLQVMQPLRACNSSIAPPVVAPTVTQRIRTATLIHCDLQLTAYSADPLMACITGESVRERTGCMPDGCVPPPESRLSGPQLQQDQIDARVVSVGEPHNTRPQQQPVGRNTPTHASDDQARRDQRHVEQAQNTPNVNAAPPPSLCFPSCRVILATRRFATPCMLSQMGQRE